MKMSCVSLIKLQQAPPHLSAIVREAMAVVLMSCVNDPKGMTWQICREHKMAIKYAATQMYLFPKCLSVLHSFCKLHFLLKVIL